MQNSSKDKQIKNNLGDFKKISPSDIPDNLKDYNVFFLSNKTFADLKKDTVLDAIKSPSEWFYFFMTCFLGYYKEMIDEILNYAEGELKFPIGYEYLEKYLADYKIEYTGISKNYYGVKSIDGLHEVNHNNDTISIFYNQELSEEEIRFTIAHELFHCCQYIDRTFKSMIDDLIAAYEPHSSNIVRTLLEETTDYAAAMYLMPAEPFYKKFIETKNIYEVSNYFKVPFGAAVCRLKLYEKFI